MLHFGSIGSPRPWLELHDARGYALTRALFAKLLTGSVIVAAVCNARLRVNQIKMAASMVIPALPAVCARWAPLHPCIATQVLRLPLRVSMPRNARCSFELHCRST